MRIGSLILISIWEIWIMYYLLFQTILEKEYLRKIDKGVIWGSILIVGGLVGINRDIGFFSYSMFLIEVFILTGCVFYIHGRDIMLVLVNVAIYHMLLTLLDFFFGFLSMIFLGENFEVMVFWKPVSIMQSVIYMSSRGIVLAVIYACKEKVRTYKHYVEEYKKILFVMNFVFLIIIFRYFCIMQMMSNGEKGKTPEGVSMSLLLVMAIMVFAVVLVFKYRDIDKRNEMLKLHEKLAEEHYLNIMGMVDKNRQLIHDMKNHLAVIREYAEEENSEGIKKYLDGMTPIFTSADMGVWTRHRILDLILSQKKQRAERQGIRFEVQAEATQELVLQDSEICSVFGNLLDNALEACEKIEDGSRWIWVRIRSQRQMLFIEIANSISEVPHKKKGRFVSTKGNASEHGYGLKSVERIVDQYEGMILYDVDEAKFQVEISLFNSKH